MKFILIILDFIWNNKEFLINVLTAFYSIKIARISLKIQQTQKKEEEDKNKASKQKEDTMKALSNKLNHFDLPMQDAISYQEVVQDMLNEDMDINATNIIIQANEKIKAFIISYEKCKTEIKPLYEAMIMNESMFSLSYGYGRYIDAFREFIYFDKEFDQIIENINRLRKFTNLAKDSKQQNEYLDIFFDNRKLVSKLLENISRINVLRLEINLKYDN